MRMASEKRAKLFQSGRSRAVRLPKEFRFEGTEVSIRRAGESVVLEPVAEHFGTLDWSWMDKVREGLDPSFFEGIEEQPAMQERPELDKLFP